MKSICWIYDLFSASLLGKILSTYPGGLVNLTVVYLSYFMSLSQPHIFEVLAKGKMLLAYHHPGNLEDFPPASDVFPPAHLYT